MINIPYYDFLPYYYEIKLGGHMICSLVATFVGGTFLWIATLFYKKVKFCFSNAYAFSLFFSSALWIIPSSKPVPEEYSLAVSLFLILSAIPILKYAMKSTWSSAGAMWSVYFFSQWLVYVIVYYYLK